MSERCRLQVHPGYGFLSENTKFAAELEKIGVKFVGPNSKAILDMGDKINSKKVATAAKVSTRVLRLKKPRAPESRETCQG